MLGLHQFAGPHFQIPQIPADERALHKIKDFASFLNSLQWEADDEQEQSEPTSDNVKFDMPEGRNARDASAATKGLNPELNSQGDVTKRIGTTRWDGMDKDDLWSQAMNSIVTGENPIYYPELSEEGRLTEDGRRAVNSELFGIESPLAPSQLESMLNEPSDLQKQVRAEQGMAGYSPRQEMAGYRPLTYEQIPKIDWTRSM